MITLQTGQCGNQVGLEYWNELTQEHGIRPDGTREPQSSTTQSLNLDYGRPDLFFTASETNRYIPRSILIDLEPSVISKSINKMPMFNPRNVHLSEQGNGAANNWQQGYSYGLSNQENLIDLIDREVDKCDNLSTFQIFHSVAGGTGSGVGSLLLELLNDRYGKKMITTFSVFPSNERTSDVVVQPYNTVLTLKRLIDFSNGTFIFDNDSLNSIENTLYGMKEALAFEGTNKLISFVLASVLNPLRFPSYMYSSYESILSTLVPTPDLKFITSSLTPTSSSMNDHDNLLELLNDKYKMNRVDGVEKPKYISVVDYLIPGSNNSEINKGILKSQARLEFVPWTANSVSVILGNKGCRKDPKFAGIQVSNNTSIASVFGKILRQYDLLAKREAYINYYTENNSNEERGRVMEIFNECKETILGTIDEYKGSQYANYLDDNEDDMS